MNTLYEPKVSIVIPAYNASNYLAEAIDSALAQTYPRVEIIVVNDGSRDDGATREIALSYGDKIRYFEKENGGSSSALNMGIANMTGEWFSWLSHDDLYAPDKIEAQIRCIRESRIPPKDLWKHIFFAGSDIIDRNGNTVHACNQKEALRMAAFVDSLENNAPLIAEPTHYLFHGCSCLVHKKAFEECGTFDQSLRLLNDLDIWFRLYAAEYRVHFIPSSLVKGRVHGAQVSKSIGYSYHNPEQDMFWKRSLDWLLEHHADEKDLFFRFGRNAYLKTRDVDGDRAFAWIAKKSPKEKGRLLVLKTTYRGRAAIRSFAKKVYLKFKT